LNFVNISLKGENTNSGSFQKETYEGTILVVEPNFNFLVLFNPQQKTRFLAGPSFGYNIVIKNNVEGTFENPGVVINRKEFPPINGFLTPGIDFIVEGNFGKVQLQYSRLMNMIDKRFTTLTGNAFRTICYGYVFKKRAD
jgi:hypothetical protein